MTLDASFVADALVNLFGAAGAILIAHEVRRRDPRGPVSRRIAFALWFVAVLFVTRTWSWYTGSLIADASADALATGAPLASLIVAEGLMRRHAPRHLKLALLAAPAIVFAAKLVPSLPELVPIVLLLATVLGGFLSIAFLFWNRDRDGLTAAENTTIRHVLLALLLLAPLIVTDFRSILPDVPVRLGALGALILLYIGLGVGNFHASLSGRLASLAVFCVIALVFALGYVSTGHVEGGTSQIIRAGAAGLAGLLFASLFSEAQGARLERSRGSAEFLGATNPEEFMRRLSSHPLLGDARLLDTEALQNVDSPEFRALLSCHPVLRRAAAPWGGKSIDNGVERALSILTAHDATHLLMLTSKPLRVLTLSLPATAADARAEAEIDLVRLVGELAHTKSST